jgi:L-lactate dehydrogenase
VKLSIIGMGHVGQAIAFAAVIKGLADEMVLVGRRADSATGDAMDLRHASCFSTPVEVRSGTIADTQGSNVVVVTAAASTDFDSCDRRRSGAPNAALFRQLIPPLAKASPAAVFIIVTNPVDALTRLAQHLSGLPPNQVLGTGTLLDTLRLRALLARRVGVHPHDLRIYILGEHGDSQVAVMSSASVGGAPLGIDPLELTALAAEARDAGYAVAKAKGYTSHAIASATMMIVEAIAKDAHVVLPVSTRLSGYCGVSEMWLSVPAIVGRGGVIRTLGINMNEQEIAQFQRSAAAVDGLTLAWLSDPLSGKA